MLSPSSNGSPMGGKLLTTKGTKNTKKWEEPREVNVVSVYCPCMQ